MASLVIHASRHGNTTMIAEAVVEGLRARGEARLLSTSDASGPERPRPERRGRVTATPARSA